MVIISLFSWWYSAGWLELLRRCGEKIKSVMQFFSVPQLVISLFAPFRQISAGSVRGSLGVQFRAWGDRLVSRFIGAIIRIFLIIFGIIAFIIASVLSVALCIIWPLLPVAPLICFIFVGAIVQ